MVTELHYNRTAVICGWTAVVMTALRQHVHECTLKATTGALAQLIPSTSIELEAQEKY